MPIADYSADGSVTETASVARFRCNVEGTGHRGMFVVFLATSRPSGFVLQCLPEEYTALGRHAVGRGIGTAALTAGSGCIPPT